jgi:hypothetical protein
MHQGSPFLEALKQRLASAGAPQKEISLYELKEHFVECSLD